MPSTDPKHRDNISDCGSLECLRPCLIKHIHEGLRGQAWGPHPCHPERDRVPSLQPLYSLCLRCENIMAIYKYAPSSHPHTRNHESSASWLRCNVMRLLDTSLCLCRLCFFKREIDK